MTPTSQGVESPAIPGRFTLLAQTFLWEARKLAEQHREVFSRTELDEMDVHLRGKAREAVEGGELASVTVGSVLVDVSGIDLTNAEPQSVLSEIASLPLPNVQELTKCAIADAAKYPLQFLFPSITLEGGKIAGEAPEHEGRVASEVERRIVFDASCVGSLTMLLLERGRDETHLTAVHCAEFLQALEPRPAYQAIIEAAFERLLAGDGISAGHILAPRIEDSIRQVLGRHGINTADFRLDHSTGRARTDDASLGALMRRTGTDGRSARDILGEDLWETVNAVLLSPTGPNLRNGFAHGLASAAHCERTMVGLLAYLLIRLQLCLPHKPED